MTLEFVVEVSELCVPNVGTGFLSLILEITETLSFFEKIVSLLTFALSLG